MYCNFLKFLNIYIDLDPRFILLLNVPSRYLPGEFYDQLYIGAITYFYHSSQ
jgi:hypothetical protein